MARIPYWNINYGILIDLLSIPVMLVFAYGLWLHWKKISQGNVRVNPRIKNILLGIGQFDFKNFFVKGVLNSKLYRDPFSGLAHGFLFWGMATLFCGTCLVISNIIFGLPVFNGSFNTWAMAFGLDLAGLMALVGIAFFLLRRMNAPDRLKVPVERQGFVPVSSILFAVLMTGFIIEGARISANGPESGAFVGNIVASILTGSSALAVHEIAWWVHGLLALSFIALIPFSPLVHLVLAPVNSGFADSRPGVKMGVMDFSIFEDEEAEEMPPLGAEKLSDFNRKRFMDYATCLWCGRCQEVCPAHNTDKPLSPKAVMVKMAEHLEQGGLDAAIAETIGMDAIFNCTTCAACMDACPSNINQPKTIMRFRQNLVMEQGSIPELMGKAVSSLEQRQHPFFGTGSGAAEWRSGLDVPFFEAGKTEYLLWIGCAVTYEQRAWEIGRSMVKILDKAGVSYGILEDARCTGDPAKQMGNEFLFAEIAQQNIDDFAAMGVKKIITLCPHCYNSFTRHYPLMGAEFEVVPHASLISELIADGKLSVNNYTKTITYHDPCYLGRRNGIYDAPRKVLDKVGGIIEMPLSKNESFCCGGGGGNYWTEETGTRINQTRAGHAMDTGAHSIAVSCPFCLLMLTDGVKKYTEETRAYDIAEIVAQSLDA